LERVVRGVVGLALLLVAAVRADFFVLHRRVIALLRDVRQLVREDELPVLARRVVAPGAEEHVLAVGERLGAGLVGGGLRLGVVVHAHVAEIFSVGAAEVLLRLRRQRLAGALFADRARGHRVRLLRRRARAAIQLPPPERRIAQLAAAASAAVAVLGRRRTARPFGLLTIGHGSPPSQVVPF